MMPGSPAGSGDGALNGTVKAADPRLLTAETVDTFVAPGGIAGVLAGGADAADAVAVTEAAELDGKGAAEAEVSPETAADALGVVLG